MSEIQDKLRETVERLQRMGDQLKEFREKNDPDAYLKAAESWWEPTDQRTQLDAHGRDHLGVVEAPQFEDLTAERNADSRRVIETQDELHETVERLQRMDDQLKELREKNDPDAFYEAANAWWNSTDLEEVDEQFKREYLEAWMSAQLDALGLHHVDVKNAEHPNGDVLATYDKWKQPPVVTLYPRFIEVSLDEAVDAIRHESRHGLQHQVRLALGLDEYGWDASEVERLNFLKRLEDENKEARRNGEEPPHDPVFYQELAKMMRLRLADSRISEAIEESDGYEFGWRPLGDEKKYLEWLRDNRVEPKCSPDSLIRQKALRETGIIYRGGVGPLGDWDPTAKFGLGIEPFENPHICKPRVAPEQSEREPRRALPKESKWEPSDALPMFDRLVLQEMAEYRPDEARAAEQQLLASPEVLRSAVAEQQARAQAARLEEDRRDRARMERWERWQRALASADRKPTAPQQGALPEQQQGDQERRLVEQQRRDQERRDQERRLVEQQRRALELMQQSQNHNNNH